VSAWNVTATWAANPALAIGGFGQVRTGSLSYRTGPDTSATKLGTVDTGTIVAVTGGPITADGYVWWQVTQPVLEWGTVTFSEAGVWMASGPVATPSDYIGAYRAPNSTTVSAAIRVTGFNGLGSNSLGAANGAQRFVSPNSAGDHDTIRLDWASTVTLDALMLRILRSDGTLVTSKSLSDLAPGAAHYTWDGTANGAPVADGTYLLQLVGTAGSTTYSAPSADPATPAQVAAFAITVNRLPTTRLAGPNRFATAADISAATFEAGVPVVYIANGLNFPDALAGAAAAGKAGGPVLLVSPTSIAPPVAQELTRLKPARIVVLGGTSSVSDTVMAAARVAALQ
jgi:hypothetical protein